MKPIQMDAKFHPPPKDINHLKERDLFMRVLKVFVLTHMRRTKDNDTNNEVKFVASTMTKAKAMFAAKKELILGEYEDEHPDDYEVYENHPTYWGISCKDVEIWDELLITEKEVDKV